MGTINPTGTWMTYNNVGISTNITGLANVAYKPGTLAAVWFDFGSSENSFTQTQFVNFSTDFGSTWNATPTVLNTFPSTDSVNEFPPNTFFSGGTLLNFYVWSPNFPTTPLSSGLNYLLPGSTTAQSQTIGNPGLEGPFGLLSNKSFMVGVGIDTAHTNTLNLVHGELGATFKLNPKLSFNDVSAARSFQFGDYGELYTIERNGKLWIDVGHLF